MKEAFFAGDYKKSGDLAKLQLDQDPTNVEALHIISRSLQQQSLFEEAIRYGLREVVLSGSNLGELEQARNYVNLADMYFSSQQHDKGYRWLQKSYGIFQKLKLESTLHFFPFWIATGRMYRGQGQWQEALNSVEQAIRLIPKGDSRYNAILCGAFTDKGHAYAMLKNNKEALFCYMEARQLCISKEDYGPYYATICVSISRLYFTVGHFQEALPFAVEALATYERLWGPHHVKVGEVEGFVKKCKFRIIQPKPALVPWTICKGNGSQCSKCRRYFAIITNEGQRCDSCFY